MWVFTLVFTIEGWKNMQSPSPVYCHHILWMSSLSLLCVAQGEYCIKDKQVPSYLYRKFDNLEEAVFPRDIRINMSLMRVSGILLYSIDRNMNQLILTLYDSIEATLGVEINKHQFDVTLPKLCSCEKCRFEAFHLRLRVGETLQLQCNGGIVISRIYRPSYGVNIDYILPYNDTGSDTSSNNGAHLWLVNNPQHGRIYPNNDQLSGCIFNVSYLGRDLRFTEVSANVGTVCKKVCIGDICNGGQCLETYNEEHVCNCTSTFNNGIYCNDTIHAMNARSSYPYHAFEAFKLSWRSSSREILILENMNVSLTLSHASGFLTFEYKTDFGGDFVTILILSKHYEPGKEYIFIGTFYGKFVNVQIYNNITWFHWTLWTGRDIGYEKFTNVTLRSGNGVIGMVFKTSLQDYRWMNVSMSKYMLLKEERNLSQICQIQILPIVAAAVCSGAICATISSAIVAAINNPNYFEDICRRRSSINNRRQSGNNDIRNTDEQQDNNKTLILPQIVGYEPNLQSTPQDEGTDEDDEISKSDIV